MLKIVTNYVPRDVVNGYEMEEGLPWSDYDWREYLECEADSLIECFVDNWEEHVNERT